jgi:WD40 repeat protein
LVARLWDTSTGKEVNVLRGHEDEVVWGEFSPDGTRLVTASWDRTARVWDAATLEPLYTLRGHECSLYYAGFSPDGRRIITVSDESNRRRSPEIRRLTQTIDHLPASRIDPPFQPGERSLGSSSYTASSYTESTGTWGEAGVARVWDAATGKQLAVLEISGWRLDGKRHFLGPDAVAFSPDGQSVVIASKNGAASIWNVTTGKEVLLRSGSKVMSLNLDGQEKIFVLDGQQKRIHASAFGAEGRQLYAVDNKTLRTWDAATGKELAATALKPHEGGVVSASFSPNGRQFVTTSLDRTASLWESETGKEIAVLRGHQDTINSAGFSADGRRILTVSADGTARLWDAAADFDVATVLRGHQSAVYSVVFSPNGQRVLTASADTTARLWDAETGRPLTVLKPQVNVSAPAIRKKLLGVMRTATFSPDGKRILTLSQGMSATLLKPAGGETYVPFAPARIWDADSGKELLALAGYPDQIRTDGFSPDGKRLLACPYAPLLWFELDPAGFERAMGPDPSAVFPSPACLWDLTTGKRIPVLPWGNKDFTRFAVFSPAGDKVLTADPDFGRICDASSGQELVRLEALPHNSARSSPDGGQTFVVKVWFDDSAQFSPDGGQVLLFKSGSQVPAQPGMNYASSGPFSPAESTATICDATSGKKFASLTGHRDAIVAAAYSPDSRRIVTASNDGTARIWDAVTGHQLALLQGHLRAVNDAAFSPDGRWVVTASADRTARIWQADSGQEFLTLSGHRDAVHTAVFSADGRRVLTASSDGTARLWPVDPLPIAEARKPRHLSPEEEARFRIGVQKQPGAP